ncbi:Helix-turn-helix [Flavobacterium micromati]|jgi:transcriptional regulator with XRE-family HTH domain|uniref:Helix-turn-helix n=1 Tax=Flavobacterium micromati TaxID=229205 RepID=A0A1M5Q324_9FLAO|nr:helix-turn-helix domain-containing protein [Flavobacterium micromati]SHH08280.1 Helix-turn-helix [Flavobacterium micromati]
MKTKNLENFQKLVSNEQSGWLDKFLYYKANKSWLNKSAMVAVNVLEALKAKGWSQKDLAQKMKVSAQQVNKILKGQQNLTFETISKLETALEISLIEVIEYKPVAEIKTSAIHIKSASITLKEEFIVVSVNKETSTT